MVRTKASNGRKLESAVFQIKDAKQRLLMMLASNDRAFKALEKSAVALSECRQLLLEAETLLGHQQMSSGKARYHSRTIALRIVARDKKQRALRH